MTETPAPIGVLVVDDHPLLRDGLADPGAVAAIRAGDDVLAADKLGVAADALRDQFRMLDEIRFGFEHAGDQHLAVRQLDRFEQGPFMRMARIGGLERNRIRLGA
jgi:hypothetical protein